MNQNTKYVFTNLYTSQQTSRILKKSISSYYYIILACRTYIIQSYSWIITSDYIRYERPKKWNYLQVLHGVHLYRSCTLLYNVCVQKVALCSSLFETTIMIILVQLKLALSLYSWYWNMLYRLTSMWCR